MHIACERVPNSHPWAPMSNVGVHGVGGKHLIGAYSGTEQAWAIDVTMSSIINVEKRMLLAE